MSARDEACVFRCALDDTYFVAVTGTVELKQFRGKQGKAAYDERNAARQRALPPWELLRCPSCVELCSNQSYEAWLRDCDRETARTPLSPCFAVSFEEGEPPPMFVDRKNKPGGKPKYELASGVGPGGLEIDGSYSGRIWKPSLKLVGIDRPRYEQQQQPGTQRSAEEHAAMQSAAETALCRLAPPEAEALARKLEAACPAYATWAAASGGVGAVVDKAVARVQAEAEACDEAKAREGERLAAVEKANRKARKEKKRAAKLKGQEQ